MRRMVTSCAGVIDSDAPLQALLDVLLRHAELREGLEELLDVLLSDFGLLFERELRLTLRSTPARRSE